MKRSSITGTDTELLGNLAGEPRNKGPRSAQELEAEIALYRSALEKSRDELQMFAYSVSHDLRAPLRAIEGFSRILLEDFSKALDPEAQRFLKHITANTQHLSSQIDDLLRYYRVGKNAPAKIEVDTNAICQEALLAASSPASKKANVVRHDLPAVAADPVQLREIFTQLIGNALKFSGQRNTPKIEIGSKVESGATTFYIKDNGVGFDEKHADKLFQVFQKLHSVTDYPGNGIGLAIARRLVEAHGGCIAAKAKPEAGATFCFCLPTAFSPTECNQQAVAAVCGAA